MITRRKFVTGVISTGLLAGAGVGTVAGNLSAAPARAAVYRRRGAGSCDGCSEAVARLLGSSPTPLEVEFVGPNEPRELSPETLAGALVYAQPGGGDVATVWRHLREHTDTIRQWVQGGGNYLGFCLGAYLAGSNPGFGLLPGDPIRYISSPGATVTTESYTTVAIDWRGQRKQMYFQDGPAFQLAPNAPATVLATYPNGEPAASTGPLASRCTRVQAVQILRTWPYPAAVELVRRPSRTQSHRTAARGIA
jgi:Biotin-protein ligase, N terminal